MTGDLTWLPSEPMHERIAGMLARIWFGSFLTETWRLVVVFDAFKHFSEAWRCVLCIEVSYSNCLLLRIDHGVH